MSNKKILQLILKIAGLKMENYQLVKEGSIVGYEFEAHLNGKFQFEVATDSFEDAVKETLEGIYNLQDVEFNSIF